MAYKTPQMELLAAALPCTLDEGGEAVFYRAVTQRREGCAMVRIEAGDCQSMERSSSRSSFTSLGRKCPLDALYICWKGDSRRCKLLKWCRRNTSTIQAD